MIRFAAFRYSGGRWLPGTLHEGLGGPDGAHREVGGGYGQPPPGPGEIVDIWSGLPVYRTGVLGVPTGHDALGSSCVPEEPRLAAGIPIRADVPWTCPPEYAESDDAFEARLAAKYKRPAPALDVFGIDFDPRYPP